MLGSVCPWQSVPYGKGYLSVLFVNGHDFNFYRITDGYMVVNILYKTVCYLRYVYKSLSAVFKLNNSTERFDSDYLSFYNASCLDFISRCV